MTTGTERAINEVMAKLASILTMARALDNEDEETVERAQQTIRESVLSVEVRSDWQQPGSMLKPTEYSILLCTGGPAVRIVGELNEYQEPVTVHLEYQDWFTPWVDYEITAREHDVVLLYALQFAFA